MRAVIYCRVSTKEQAEQGYSLEAQEKECRSFAIKNGYEVERVFIEAGESAKTQDRTQLHNLLKYTVENKKKLSALIIWKFNRLARNMSDHHELINYFSKFGIRVLSATENNDETSAGKLNRNMIGAIAQFENDQKSEMTISGMKEAVASGRWCWQAPIGYKFVRDNLNKPLLIPNEESPYIEHAFKLAESGLYKQTEIAEQLKKKGFKKATKSLVNRILKHPVYAGLIKIDWFTDFITGLHKPIVTQETFFKVQNILNGKRPSITKKVRNNPDFPLRNFVRCPKCGQKLTGSKSTGRKGVKYPYYHCRTKKCSLNVRKNDLEGYFYEYLKTFQPNEEIVDLFKAIILDVWKAKQTEKINEQIRLEKELGVLQGKKNKIDELMIKGIFDDETYKQKSQEIRGEITVKKIEFNDLSIEVNDIEACVNFCKYFLANISSLWQNSELNLRQRFQQIVFPEGLTYQEDGTFGTASISPIFKLIQSKDFQKSYLASLMKSSWNQIVQDVQNIYKLREFVPVLNNGI